MSKVAPGENDQYGHHSGDVPMPAPALPEYIEHTMPPPSYEEIMGHQTQTSVQQQTTTDIPPLAYVDIMPRLLQPGSVARKMPPKFDKFSIVIEAANEWLRNNIGYAVWKCETVERKIEKGPPGRADYIDLDKMTIQHSTYGFNVFVRGVRMWLVKKTDRGPPQQLGLMNVVPEKQFIEYSRVRHRGRHMFMFDDPYYHTMMTTHQIETYDTVTETIAKLNSKLKQHPLPGTILNVEGAMMKTFEFGDHVEVDPDNTSYSSQYKGKRLTQILRIFYVLGPPAHEEIHLQEFKPEILQPAASVMSQPVWQSWADVNGQLGYWLANTRGIRVVNIQAFNARLNRRLGQCEILSNCSDEVQTSFLTREFMKILRVFYTTGSSAQSPPITHFGSRLFLPVRIGARVFEGMNQTMYRIEAWLRATGVPIYNVETVQYLLYPGKTLGVEAEKCQWTDNPSVGSTYVVAIRVYFPCTFAEPDPRLLPPQPYYDPTAGDGCCNVC